MKGRKARLALVLLGTITISAVVVSATTARLTAQAGKPAQAAGKKVNPKDGHWRGTNGLGDPVTVIVHGKRRLTLIANIAPPHPCWARMHFEARISRNGTFSGSSLSDISQRTMSGRFKSRGKGFGSFRRVKLSGDCDSGEIPFRIQFDG